MHELPLIKTIYQSVMEFAKDNNAKKVNSVYLQIGVLRDFIPSYIVKYWKYVSKDTIAADSKIYIEEIPATARCSKCNRIYVINPEHIEETKCPECGCDEGFLLTGREVILERIDII